MAPTNRPSPVALAVLSLLRAGPLHPYGMQRLIKDWHKDQVINVGHRANLYKIIKRLADDGLIAIHQVERDQAYPERTVYELTDTGDKWDCAGWPTCSARSATSTRIPRGAFLRHADGTLRVGGRPGTPRRYAGRSSRRPRGRTASFQR